MTQHQRIRKFWHPRVAEALSKFPTFGLSSAVTTATAGRSVGLSSMPGSGSVTLREM